MMSIWQQRADRALGLCLLYPASRDVLTFIAELSPVQEQIASLASDWNSLLGAGQLVCQVVRRCGPGPLRSAISELDEVGWQRVLRDYWELADVRSPRSFFARALLQPFAASERIEVAVRHLGPRPLWQPGSHCPRCGDLPQVGLLRPQEAGRAQFLFCSLCLKEWSFRRGCCPGCGEAAEKHLAYYEAASYPQFQVQTCQKCRTYLLTIDLSKNVSAIPDIDELAALPLNLWAQEQGYVRLQPNLVGI